MKRKHFDFTFAPSDLIIKYFSLIWHIPENVMQAYRRHPQGMPLRELRCKTIGLFSLRSRELLLKKATISLLYYIIKALINSLMESCCGRTKEEFMMKICQLWMTDLLYKHKSLLFCGIIYSICFFFWNIIVILYALNKGFFRSPVRGKRRKSVWDEIW